MLVLPIPEREGFDETTNTFTTIGKQTLKLEHSLLSLQKWESRHHKYFIENKELTNEEVLDYIRCMTLNQVDDNVYFTLTADEIKKIMDYIKDPMTATWFNDGFNKKKISNKKEIITAEVIYSSLIILGIPVDIFEKRHLNHVLTLIRVCNEKQNPDSTKVNPKDVAMHYSELNKARRKALGTKG